MWLAWSLLFVFLLLLLLLLFSALLVSSFMRFAQRPLLLEGEVSVEEGDGVGGKKVAVEEVEAAVEGGGRNKTPVFEPLYPTSKVEQSHIC